jgi:hypothetical protein
MTMFGFVMLLAVLLALEVALVVVSPSPITIASAVFVAIMLVVTTINYVLVTRL